MSHLTFLGVGPRIQFIHFDSDHWAGAKCSLSFGLGLALNQKPRVMPLEGKTLPFLNWPLEYCKRLGIKELTLGGIKDGYGTV